MISRRLETWIKRNNKPGARTELFFFFSKSLDYNTHSVLHFISWPRATHAHKILISIAETKLTVVTLTWEGYFLCNGCFPVFSILLYIISIVEISLKDSGHKFPVWQTLKLKVRSIPETGSGGKAREWEGKDH